MAHSSSSAWRHMERISNEARQAGLLVATIGSFMTPFMGSAATVALPAIGREFAMSAVLLSWVATAFLLAAAIFLVPFGRLADIYGRKRVFLIGTFLYGFSSLLCALAPSGLLLIVLRVPQGMGGAMIFSTSTAIITSIFPAGERGRILGINVAAVYVGLSLGPFVGGILTQQWGWRSVFLVGAPLALIVIAAVVGKLHGEWSEARGEAFDLVGAIIYGGTLLAFMYGLSLLPATTAIWLLLIAMVGLVVFILRGRSVESPVLDLHLFRTNVVFAFSNLAALINYSATSAVGFLLSLYLQYIKGLSPQEAGTVLVMQPIVQAIFSPLAGRLSDRLEPRLLASAGMGLTVAGLTLLINIGINTPLLFVILTLALLGLGFALFSAPNTNAIMGSVDKRLYGMASATLATMRTTGQMLSMGIAMLLFALYIGRVQITPEYYPLFVRSVRVAFAIFAILCFVGILASLARGRRQ